MKIWLLPVFAMLAGSALAAPSSVDPRVRKIMALTRNTQATYSLYAWNVIKPAGEPQFGQWSAEFHSGSLHRVESGDNRVIADCKQMTASYFDPQQQRIVDDDKAARVACGVADHKPILRGVYLGRAASRFGQVERIRIEDADTIRTYSIDRRGVIVAQTVADAKGRLALTLEVREVRSWVPKAIFSRESLDHSVVPESMKVPPA